MVLHESSYPKDVKVVPSLSRIRVCKESDTAGHDMLQLVTRQ
jgi:hypothetical protein